MTSEYGLVQMNVVLTHALWERIRVAAIQRVHQSATPLRIQDAVNYVIEESLAIGLYIYEPQNHQDQDDSTTHGDVIPGEPDPEFRFRDESGG